MIPGHAILVAVCIFMLPMLEIAAEHAQLMTTHHTNPADLCGGHVTISHSHQVLPYIKKGASCHGPPEPGSEVKHASVTLLVPFQCLSCSLQPGSRCPLQSEEGGGGCGGSTLVTKWRHRDKPRP